MQNLQPLLISTDFPEVTRSGFTTLQANLGYLCNQVCHHCHVNAGPKRKELMSLATMEQLLAVMDRYPIHTLDLTGGAPEMNPHFRHLVQQARARNVKVIDRCNLTILSEPGYEGLAEFLAEQRCEVVASLPCYLEDNVDAQRGNGVFERSIAGLQQLNALGYGQADSGLSLNLVYNPQGAVLAPGQAGLQAAYKEQLSERFGVVFNQLFTITNMPIKRFANMLHKTGKYQGYMDTLRQAYNPAALGNVMCRELISVDWQGKLYDCDFNQQLELPIAASSGMHLTDLLTEAPLPESIYVADHCYGCTAGQGSSCGGALGD